MNKPRICKCVKTKPHKEEYHERKIGPSGPENAEVMVVGMAPGMDEAINGQYFCGASGKQLQKDFVASGLSWKDTRIQNVAQYWPKNHNLSNLSDEQRDEGLAALMKDIEEVQPKVIVPVGGDALKILTGHTRITNWRGTPIQLNEHHPNLPPALVIPTIHPSALLRDWDFHTLVLHDLNKVATYLREGWDAIKPRERRLVTKGDEEYEAACKYFVEAAEKGTLLAADIEVFQGEISCISFADSADYSVSVDGKDREVWRTILEAECPKVWHNAMYDLTFLKAREGIEVAGEVHDTQLLWHALYPSLACSNVVGKSLAVLVSLFTNEPYYKYELQQWKTDADWDLLYEYNARDSAVTYECFDALRGQIEKQPESDDLDRVYRFECSLVKPYGDASIRGVKIDTRAKGAKAGSTKKRLKSLVAELRELVDDDSFNPRSWQQVKAAFKKFGTTTKSTSKAALTRLMLHSEDGTPVNELASKMLEYRKLQKAYGTYYNFKHDDDGYIRTSWIIPGTETGRMANSKSIIFKGGANLMTIPRAARPFFIAEDGYKMVYADLSQAEARIVAYLSGCERLINAFESGKDVYKQVASWMFDKPYEEIDYDERYLAKRCVLGLLYGMGPYKWRQQINIDKGYDYISQKEANRLYEKFFDTFPEIRGYHRWCERTVRRTRRMRTLGPVPRRRIFRSRNGQFTDHMYREAYDYPPQGTVPDIVNTAVLALEEVEGIELLGQIHDAWFGLVRCGGEMEENLRTIKEALTIPIEVTAVTDGVTRTLTIPVDMQIGDNWGDYDEEDNPNGLKEIEV